MAPAAKRVPGIHVAAAYDYDDYGVYVPAPTSGTSGFYGWGTVMWMWNAVDGMGLAVGPY